MFFSSKKNLLLDSKTPAKNITSVKKPYLYRRAAIRIFFDYFRHLF